MADIFLGGVGCECCECVATEVCSDCFVTGPYKLTLDRVQFDPEGSDCTAFDWSPTDQCITLCGAGGSGPITAPPTPAEQPFTISGQAFTLKIGAAIGCFSGNRLGLQVSIDIILAGCTGTSLTLFATPIILYIGDADVCDVTPMLGSYNFPGASTGTGQWTLDFTLAEGAC